MARIRTIKKAYEEIKKDDPNTNLTLSALRRLVLNGTIPSQRSGTKYLIDIDTIKDVLFNTKEVVI